MRFLLLLFFLPIFQFSCNSQPKFSTENKVEINDNLFFAKQTEGFVAFTKSEEYLFSVDYDSIISLNPVRNIFYKIKKKGKYGVMDHHGIELVYPEYEAIENLNNSVTGQMFLKMKYDGKWGVMAFVGQTILDHFVYDEMGNFGDSKGLLLVKKDGKYGFRDINFNNHGDRSTPLKYDYLENYKNGGSKFKLNGKEGKLAISEKTGYLTEFYPNEKGVYPKNKFVYPHASLSVFKENGKSGLRNKKTKAIVLPPTYDHLLEKAGHTEAIFYAKKNEKRGILNSEGKVIIPLKYKNAYGIPKEKRRNSATSYGHHYSIFYAEDENGKKGIYDFTGKQLLPVKYDQIQYAKEYHMFLKKDEKWGLFDTETQTFKLKLEWDKFKKERT